MTIVLTCCEMMSMVTRNRVIYMQLITWGCFTSPIHRRMYSLSLLWNKPEHSWPDLTFIYIFHTQLDINKCFFLWNWDFGPPAQIDDNVIRWHLLNCSDTLIYFLPAAVEAVSDPSVEDVSVGLEGFTLGAEDDAVVSSGGQDEEEHFELKAHPEEDSACDERQDAAVHGVLRERQAIK